MSTAHTANDATAKKPARWVDDELARLDPEKDYERMVGLVSEYKLNDFIMNLNYTSGFMGNIMPETGSKVMKETRKAELKPQTRYLDTVKFFWPWFIKGPSDPEVKASIIRLNRLHAHLYKDYRSSFDNNDDWIYTLCNLGTTPDRMRKAVGAPLQPEPLQRAWYYFWRDLASQMTGAHGQLHSFPDSYAQMLEFFDEFESRGYEPAPNGKIVCEQLLAQFNERFFPKPLHGLGRTLVLTFVSPAVIKRHGLAAPNKAGSWLVRKAFKFIFFAQDHFAPDAKIPSSQVLSSQKYQSWKKEAISAEKHSVRTTTTATSQLTINQLTRNHHEQRSF